ncbi:MAG: LuxR C-terminal-related transcriptional regulator [Acidimicrobiales bacterium]
MGRLEELELLAASVIEDASSWVVAGAAGVGKSRLVTEVLDRIADAGIATATVRATRATATIPFGAFAQWVPDIEFAGENEAGPNRLQLLTSLSTALIGDRPRMVVVVDDAHLLDDGSAALVLHLATSTPASVIVTVRSGEPCPDAVMSLWKEALADRVDLQTLSEAETASLLEGALGDVAPAAQRRVWALTRGVPLYVREVVQAAEAQGVLVQEDQRWRWTGSLAGSERLKELIAERLREGAGEERRLVELLAIGEPLSMSLIEALGLGPQLSTADLHGLVALQEGSEADGPAVHLVHPLYGEVLRGEISPVLARAHRSELVRAALHLGWEQRDPLLIAEWALGSDVHLDAALLVAAARRALALSEWDLTERLSRAADPGAQGQAVLVRTIALTNQQSWDGDMVEVAERALSSLSDDPSPAAAGEVARVLSSLLYGRPEHPVTLREVTAAVSRLPAAYRRVAFVHCGLQAMNAALPDDAVRLAERARSPSGALDDDVEVQSVAVLAFARSLQGRPAEALRAAESVLARVPEVLAADPIPGNPAGPAATFAYCFALVGVGRIEEAAAAAHFVHDETVRMGSIADQALAATVAARMDLLAGRLATARTLADGALASCLEIGQYAASSWPASVLGLAAAQQGDLSRIAELLEWAEVEWGARLMRFDAQAVRTWMHASAGEMSAARAAAVDCAEQATAAGLHAIALGALHDLARLGGAQMAADRLDSIPTEGDGPFAVAVRAYVAALVAGDAPALSASSNRFEAMGAMLFAAEAAAQGAALHTAASRKGSAATARGRATVLMAGCEGPRTPAVLDLTTDPAMATLTAREREVVRLAASGLTNRDIADRLFVSVRTVTTHLYRSYTKLGVNDRDHLAALLDADPRDEPTLT